MHPFLSPKIITFYHGQQNKLLDVLTIKNIFKFQKQRKLDNSREYFLLSRLIDIGYGPQLRICIQQKFLLET